MAGVKLRISSRPSLKVRMIPVFPATVRGEGGISITKEDGVFIVQLDNPPVLSFNARTGNIMPVLGDYSASIIENDSGVSGDTVSEALDALASAIFSALESRDTGGTVTVDAGDRGFEVGSISSNLTFNLGQASDRNQKPFTVALNGADPETYTITVAFDGSETCRGASSFVFESPYQVVTFYPNAAGDGWYIG